MKQQLLKLRLLQHGTATHSYINILFIPPSLLPSPSHPLPPSSLSSPTFPPHTLQGG